MSFLKSIGHSLRKAGSTISKGASSAGGTVAHAATGAGDAVAHEATSASDAVAHEATGAAHTVAHGASRAADTVGEGADSGAGAARHAAQTVETSAGTVAVTGASEVESGVGEAAAEVSSGASAQFDAAVRSGQAAFDGVKSALQKALEDGEAKILGPAAKHLVSELRGPIEAARADWTKASKNLPQDVETLRAAAMSKKVTAGAKEAFERISKEMGSSLGAFFSKSYVSFGVEFGASATFGAGVEAALGVLAGLPDVADIRGYGAVGVTAGAEAGAEADVALVFNTAAPADSGGPSINVVVSLEVDVGGTVVVSYNLPHFSLGGISIGLAGGEEAGISLGGGYTYVF